jgi:hypothetical protein
VLLAGLLADCSAVPTAPQASPESQPPGQIAVEPRALPTVAARQPGQVVLPWTRGKAERNRVVLTVASGGRTRPAGGHRAGHRGNGDNHRGGTCSGPGPCTAERLMLVGCVTTQACRPARDLTNRRLAERGVRLPQADEQQARCDR